LIPEGIGFSQELFDLQDELMARLEVVSGCPCAGNCPSRARTGGQNGYGGKSEALAILHKLVNN
jgi:hypothetical protein